VIATSGNLTTRRRTKMNNTKSLIDSLQRYKEEFKNMVGKEGTNILINDITIMQSIAMMTEDLSNSVTSIGVGIYTSLSLMQFSPEIADELVGDYLISALMAKTKGMGIK